MMDSITVHDYIFFYCQCIMGIPIDGGGCMRNTHCKSSFALLTGGVAPAIICHPREEVKYTFLITVRPVRDCVFDNFTFNSR